MVYVRVKSGNDPAHEENMRIYRSFPEVLKWLRSSKGHRMLRRSYLNIVSHSVIRSSNLFRSFSREIICFFVRLFLQVHSFTHSFIKTLQ